MGAEIVEDIVIVGAGIAGLTTALGLHRCDGDYTTKERKWRIDLRTNWYSLCDGDYTTKGWKGPSFLKREVDDFILSCGAVEEDCL